MKNYIWTLPTRLFHWLLAISFTAAYILGELDEFKNLHFAFGAFVGTIIFFRVLFGFFGPKHSRFSDFPIGFKNQVEFVKAFFANSKVYVGHNPLASLVMISIFIIGIACSLSGFLFYATENNVLSLNLGEDFLGEMHEILATLFLILVIFHLAGIFLDLIFHPKNGIFQSIFTGYKNVEAQKVELNSFQKFFSVLWLVVPFMFFYLAFGLQITNHDSENSKSDKTEQHEGGDDD